MASPQPSPEALSRAALTPCASELVALEGQRSRAGAAPCTQDGSEPCDALLAQAAMGEGFWELLGNIHQRRRGISGKSTGAGAIISCIYRSMASAAMDGFMQGRHQSIQSCLSSPMAGGKLQRGMH